MLMYDVICGMTLSHNMTCDKMWVHDIVCDTLLIHEVTWHDSISGLVMWQSDSTCLQNMYQTDGLSVCLPGHFQTVVLMGKILQLLLKTLKPLFASIWWMAEWWCYVHIQLLIDEDVNGMVHHFPHEQIFVRVNCAGLFGAMMCTCVGEPQYNRITYILHIL